MAIMAGMLPGVEGARRRRQRQGAAAGDAAAASAGAHCGAGNHPTKQRNQVMEMIHEWTLDSSAREAKERLDQKLRSKREAVVSKRRHSTGSIKLAGSSGSGARRRSGGGDSTTTVQREVYSSKKGVMRRLMLRWGRRPPRWDAAAAAAEEQQHAECAVCLDEFRAGHVLAHLPCGHRFHWACALPWLEGASSCPCCRAAVVDASTNPHHAA